ncbi:MAG: MFS transporter [Actinomycetota bacterium]|nr:MFS transporter [Actinomycetota bacterium]
MRPAVRRPPIPAVVLLTLARLVVNIAQRFVYPFLPAIARGLGVSLQQAGLLLSARSLAGLATPLAVGIAGRGERRLRLLATGLLLFVGGTTITASGSLYPLALVGFLLLGLGKPVYDVGAQSYLADHSAYEVRARYLTITELTWSGSLLLGAPAAGWLIARWGWQAPFWALAALGLLAALALPQALGADSPSGTTRRQPLRLSHSAWALLVAIGVFTFGTEVTFVVFGAWLEGSFGLSLVALGAASTVLALAELSGEGGTLAFADRFGKRRAVALGLALSAAGYALLPLASGRLAAGLAVLAVAVLGFEVAVVSALPLATEILPSARGRFLALIMVSFALARGLAAAVGPALFEQVGLPGNAGLSAACNLLALAVVMLGVQQQ